MHYIRFLKHPRIDIISPKHTCKIQALITITTDLGESFLGLSIPIQVIVRSKGDPSSIIHESTHQWVAGYRQLELQCRISSIPRFQLVLTVKSARSTPHEELVCAPEPLLPAIFTLFSKSDESALRSPHVQRHINIAHGLTLRIAEDSGNSIARHIW